MGVCVCVCVWSRRRERRVESAESCRTLCRTVCRTVEYAALQVTYLKAYGCISLYGGLYILTLIIIYIKKYNLVLTW